MNFQVKVGMFFGALAPVVTCSTVGGKRDHADIGKITIEAKGDVLSASANNGFIALNKTLFSGATQDFTPSKDGILTVVAVDLFDSFSKGYQPDEIVDIAFDGKTLKAKQVGATDEQDLIMQGTDVAIAMPNVEKTFDSEFTIDRNVFVDSVNSIFHAVGDERFKPQLRFMKMIIEKDSLKVLAGDGGRYEVYERTGQGFVETKEEVNFYLSRDHSPTIMKILSSVTDTIVLIKEKKAAKSEYADQILFIVAGMTIVAMSYDPGTKFPDVYKLANRVSPCKVVTSLDEWKYGSSAAIVTNNEEKRKQGIYHTIDLAFKNKKTSIKTKGNMSVSRTVHLKDIVGEAAVRIGAEYFNDVISKHSGLAQFELVDEKSPLICKLYASDKVADGPFYRINSTTKELRTIMIGPRKE